MFAVAKWLDGSRCQMLTPGKGHSSPLFSAHVYCGHGCPSQLLLRSCCTAHGRQFLYFTMGPPFHPNCPYWLRQLRRSVDAESAATLVHAFVPSRIDYCNAVLACAPKATTDKLQRVLNAAARVVTGTKKFQRGLSRLLHTELHWLDVPERGFTTMRYINLRFTYLLTYRQK